MRRLAARLLGHPVSAIGLVLALASACVFAGLVVVHLSASPGNPYADIVVFVMLPPLFLVGVLLMAVGLRLERRRPRTAPQNEPAWPRVDLNVPETRRALLFVTVATLISLVALSFASQRAVEYSESTEFCGQTCHQVMGPHFTAHQSGLHSRVGCVECHVEPGAEGFLKAKLNGTNQLRLALTNRYPRPISSTLRVARPNVYTSCEQCHWPDRFIGDVVKVVDEFADDEANSKTTSTLRLHVGGPVAGTGSGTGIHWHMNRSNVVEYVALDESLEQIPYVRVVTRDNTVREYFAKDVSAADLEGKARRRMGCIDCHNRPAHRFASTPQRAVDAAMGAGLISTSIPFIRRESVRALSAVYSDQDAAVAGIDQSIRNAISAGNKAGTDETALRQAIAVSQAIYRTNIFPAMKIGWGTYRDRVGHTTSQGCFRCHDESHVTRDGRALGQDCELCHSIE
jgi:nitrate/TMAO reductase-like tetraheme cytochrome c subunit